MKSLSHLARSFYARPSEIVAKELLGTILHRKLGGEWLSGRIVETEAYASHDPASHSYRGKTPRNAVMFGEPGHAYVYFTYGMHFCFNVTCREEGVAEAVLIRGIEPLDGIEVMRKRRKLAKRNVDLANGPGKIGEAFGLGRTENGIDLVTSQDLFLSHGELPQDAQIGISSRVGISVGTEYLWRFFVQGNAFVSKGVPSKGKPSE
jgi:DNA-3-methyladenine glycosylase